MDKREFYLDKLNAIVKESYSGEQKETARKILNSVKEEDLDAVWGLISHRVKLGFAFDEAPEVNHEAVSCLIEDKKLGINLDSNTSKHGVTEDSVEHNLIIGENYDALKNLLVAYTDEKGKGMVDVIYIDPPYNTEKTKEEGNDYKEDVESTKFIYRDKFTRDGWLNMMNERLRLARRLLSDKGVIFVSIDDNEQAYLKVLMDEIFGEENFVSCMPRKTRGSATTKSDAELQNLHDYILLYCKNKLKFSFSKINLGVKKYPYKDDRGEYYVVDLQDNGPHGTRTARPNLYYPIYEREDGTLHLTHDFDSDIIHLPLKHKNDDGCWMWSTKKFDNEKNDLTVINNTVKIKHYYNKDEDQNKYQRRKTWLDDFQNTNGTIVLGDILSKGVFDNPKPVDLIKWCINLCNNKDAIVLDFFAGSGTTGQAVMELNEEDGEKRKFILVTNNENNIAENVTYERLFRVINGKGTKGEDFQWKYKEDNPYLKDNSLRVFNITKSPLHIDETKKAEEIKEKAIKSFKLINKNYKEKDLDIYYALSSLLPYKED